MRHTAAQSAEGLIKAEWSVVLMITQSGHLSIRSCFSEPVFLRSRSLRDFPSYGQSVCMLHRPLGSACSPRCCSMPSNATGPAHTAAEHHGNAGSAKMSQHAAHIHAIKRVQQNKSERSSRVLKTLHSIV